MEYKLLISSGLYPENQFDKKDLNKKWPETESYNSQKIDNFFREFTKDIKVDNEINEWKILIRVYLGGTMNEKNIGVSKRGSTYPSDKEKEISIHISLPTEDEINWGIADKRRFNSYAKGNSKYVDYIPVNYEKYDNMNDYIENSLQVGIEYLFKKGITLKGKIIKK